MSDLRFEWEVNSLISVYRCYLYEGDKIINDIKFYDYSCEKSREYDKKKGYVRPYSFEVDWCHGWSMSEGFDYDEECYNRYDEDGRRIGGYQGNCTHTVEDIKMWCENWLAQQYLSSYYETIATLDEKKARAKWFEAQGFKYVNEKNDK